MTHGEWLKSDDPQAMLAALVGQRPDGTHVPYAGGYLPEKWTRGKPIVSERKLRLFACAAARLFPHLPKELLTTVAACEAWADAGSPCRVSYSWAMDDPYEAAYQLADPQNGTSYGRAQVPQSTFAALLRCIVGDPWEPVTVGCVILDGIKKGKGGPGTVWINPDCVTPDVLALAAAAYGERDGRKCPTCYGVGSFGGAPMGGGSRNLKRYIIEPPDPWTCDGCNGKGRIDDGSLSPDRLAVLADALVDAGLPEEEKTQCPACDGMKGYNEMGPNTFWQTCRRCDGAGYLIEPSPLLTHLRSAGPHWRGCHCLDVILGLE